MTISLFNIIVNFIKNVLVYIILLVNMIFLTLLGPHLRPNSGQSFSICHWNLNRITAHNFSKISFLRAYNAIHNYDIICLSETYLNHETLSDSDNLKIPGYKLIRVDNSSNQKRGGICIYHKDFLPIKK